MKKTLKTLYAAAAVCSLICLSAGSVHSEQLLHIRELFDVRTAISDQGEAMSGNIQKARGRDVRTLERIFELNTSTLATIEAYFRMFRIVFSSENAATTQTVGIMNEWLRFISSQCVYDLEYLNAVVHETTEEAILEQIGMARENISTLKKIADKGVYENQGMIQQKFRQERGRQAFTM